ncbi:MAG: RluA family pseudouridine synthase [Planctomycetota bacterium]
MDDAWVWQRLEVGSGDAAGRLDVWLASALGVSRGRVVRLLEQGRVLRDGRACVGGMKGRAVETGEVFEVAMIGGDAEEDRPGAIDGGEAVLAEGAGWVVLDKRVGTPVHPLRGGETGTLVNTLVTRWPEVMEACGGRGVGEGGLRSGVVHRLDVPTSGCVVMATEQGAWERLRGAFAEHRVEKRYRAVVRGRLVASGEGFEPVDLSLAVTQHRPARVGVVSADDPRGRRCRLGYRVIEPLGDATVIEVDLQTGFLHQVRATFAHLGHPVLGDADYGGKDPRVGRLMLHAARLVIDGVEAVSPLPSAFSEGLAALAS